MSDGDQVLKGLLQLRAQLDETISQFSPATTVKLRNEELTVRRRSTKDVLEEAISENLSARGTANHIYNGAGAALILMPLVGAPQFPAFLLSTSASAIFGTIKPVVLHIGQNAVDRISLVFSAVQEHAVIYDAECEIRLRSVEAMERELAIEAAEKYQAMSPRDRERYNDEQRGLRMMSSEISRAYNSGNFGAIALYA